MPREKWAAVLAMLLGAFCFTGHPPRLMAQAPKYDLLLKGGHVIDPANGIDKALDVAISGGKIAAMAPGIPARDAGKVVDVTGLYVTPGLVDIHYHVGHGGAPLNWFAPGNHAHSEPLGIPADFALAAGVTTIADAGTAGADTFLVEKQEVIDHAKVRVLAFLNIVADGVQGETEQDVNRMNVQRCVETVRKYPDIIVGVKTAHYWASKPFDAQHPAWAAVDNAESCASIAGVPVMVDFWPRPGRTYADLILEKMRRGDIHTHVFAQQFPILLADGKLNPILLKARERGVIFDVGHGAASFWFRNAVPAVRQGFIPDSLSTDLHLSNLTYVTMTDVMSKFLAMGVPLAGVIARSTVNPAAEIHRADLGTLSLGREADVAVLELQHGHFGYIDDGWARMDGTVKLVARMTIRGGRILFDPSGLSMTEWQKARKQYFTTPELGSAPPAMAESYPRN